MNTVRDDALVPQELLTASFIFCELSLITFVDSVAGLAANDKFKMFVEDPGKLLIIRFFLDMGHWVS